MPSRTKTELYILKALEELLKQNNSNVAEIKDIAKYIGESIEATDSFLESLSGQGFVKYIKHTYGCDASLTHSGTSKISEIDDFLNSPSKKQKYLRDMYLNWIYDQNTAEIFPGTREFLGYHPAVLSYRFTESNVLQAEKELRERGFIHSEELSSGLAITANGQDYVDSQ